MDCDTCQGNSEQTLKCFLKALDTVKQHFLMMQGLCVENAQTISKLNQHNEKLQNTINILNQRCKPSPKRRRLSPKKAQRRRSSMQLADNVSPLLPESQDSLNMNIALQTDDDEEETITETEPAISPYKPWNSRHKLNTRNCENEQPTSTKTAPTDTSNAWLGKAPLSKTKMSLTLRSNSPRLKQTRLKYDACKVTNTGCDKDVIESSPNLYASLKHAKQSRSLLQRSDNNSVLNTKTSTTTSTSNNKPMFEMDDDESIFDLCPDPSPAQPSADRALPAFSGTSDTSSVVLLTPGTQEIVFIDDSITEANSLNTMDFMQEAIKEDNMASLTKLQEFEAELIRKRQMEAAKGKFIAISAAAVKHEPLTEPPSTSGNESTKLPADFDLDLDEDELEEEEIFPRPIKQEKEMSAKERYNIDCVQCEKFINFMGTNLNDEKIRKYLNNCRHHDDRELENNTPAGFWNPHMVSFTDDDPRNEVFVDRRFVDQKKK